MTEQELREKIAEAFKIARQEGVTRRFADGISDADEVMEWVKEAGYILLADDQSFPKGSMGSMESESGRLQTQQDMFKVGWRKVKKE